jgi:hypothetical protein
MSFTPIERKAPASSQVPQDTFAETHDRYQTVAEMTFDDDDDAYQLNVMDRSSMSCAEEEAENQYDDDGGDDALAAPVAMPVIAASKRPGSRVIAISTSSHSASTTSKHQPHTSTSKPADDGDDDDIANALFGAAGLLRPQSAIRSSSGDSGVHGALRELERDASGVSNASSDRKGGKFFEETKLVDGETESAEQKERRGVMPYITDLARLRMKLKFMRNDSHKE